MADRRAGKGIPHVPSKGGAQPRARNKDGRWRKKRSDHGKPRNSSSHEAEGSPALASFLQVLKAFLIDRK